MKTFEYYAVLEPGDEDGILVVTFPDVPEAITQGTGPTETQENAQDALGTALLSYPMRGLQLPAATTREGLKVAVAPDVAAKLAVLEAFATAGMSKSELARRLDRDEKEIRRMLDPMHPTKLPLLAAALTALGKRLVIGVEDLEAA